MIYQILNPSNQAAITELFSAVFTVSEGEKEGKLVGGLASELSSTIDNNETICVGALENNTLVGAIFFTRLHFKRVVSVYMLAPVAVSTEHQGKGIGQALIAYGLNELKKRSVHVAVTYGDPSYYSKVGFQPLSEQVIQAPQKLSMPFGWLGQSLSAEPIPVINERPLCVNAFNNPVYW